MAHVADDSPRVLELRRRVQADPASTAFAQLAEEWRRAGDNDKAVGLCRAGLVYHPDNLNARVTLGRALLELGRLDDALIELKVVLAVAPENLPANRALAEAYQKRGQLQDALAQYKRALELATLHSDLENRAERIENVVSPPPAVAKREASSAAVEDLFDFDALLEQLGGRTQPKPEFPRTVQPSTTVPSRLDTVQLPADGADPLARLEQQLREVEHKVYVVGPSEEALHQQRVVAELEDWLAAIVTDRAHRLSA